MLVTMQELDRKFGTFLQSENAVVAATESSSTSGGQAGIAPKSSEPNTSFVHDDRKFQNQMLKFQNQMLETMQEIDRKFGTFLGHDSALVQGASPNRLASDSKRS